MNPTEYSNKIPNGIHFVNKSTLGPIISSNAFCVLKFEKRESINERPWAPNEASERMHPTAAISFRWHRRGAYRSWILLGGLTQFTSPTRGEATAKQLSKF